jgi:ligand-binding SRPBCC domain-containing protein
MYVYEKATLLRTSQRALYEFHLDVANLELISPKDVKVTLLNKDFTPREGEVLRLRTVKNFIPMVWEVRIEKMEEPRLLVDLALKSPFAFWKHSHIFTEIDEEFCELKDVVEYDLPLGFIGRVFHFFVARELEKMFAFRHGVTQQQLEEKK